MSDSNNAWQPSSRERALALVEKIPDTDVRREAVKSLSGYADMHQMVQVFHKVYGLPLVSPAKAGKNFSHMTKDRLAMRFGLIVEEFKELCHAMDLDVEVTFKYLDEEENVVETTDVVEAMQETEERDIPEVADACFDLKYVIIGFEYETGIHPQSCATEGQASNLSKLAADGSVIYREDGKVLKGPNYFKADFRTALKAYGFRG